MAKLLAKSASIRALVDWLYSFYRNFYLMGALLDVLVAVAFTISVILYSRENEGEIVMALIVVSCFANLLGIFCSFSVLRYGNSVRDQYSTVRLMSVSRIAMFIIDVVLFSCAYGTDVQDDDYYRKEQHVFFDDYRKEQHVFFDDYRKEQHVFFAFTASVGCILCWLVVRPSKSCFLLSVAMPCVFVDQFFRTIRPFDRLGHFVSMMGYAAKDSLPFAMMGLLLMIGYSAAFMVLFGSRLGYEDGYRYRYDYPYDYPYGNGDGDISEDTNVDKDTNVDATYFDTFPHALGKLLSTGQGNFETKVNSARIQHFLVLTEVFLTQMIYHNNRFLEIWTFLLFNSFVYIGPIVLSSLLVAILTDTHDRVRSKEEAVQSMHRLQATRKCAMIGAFVKR